MIVDVLDLDKIGRAGARLFKLFLTLIDSTLVNDRRKLLGGMTLHVSLGMILGLALGKTNSGFSCLFLTFHVNGETLVPIFACFVLIKYR